MCSLKNLTGIKICSNSIDSGQFDFFNLRYNSISMLNKKIYINTDDYSYKKKQ